MILMCKKSYYLHYYFKSPTKCFIKGKFYNASMKTYPDIGAVIVDGEEDYQITFESEYYKKHFYTEAETRRMKLRKIKKRNILKIIYEALIK